jgi:hypothetical protein
MTSTSNLELPDDYWTMDIEPQLAKYWPMILVIAYTILALLIITPLFRELMPAMPIVFLFLTYGVERFIGFLRDLYPKIGDFVFRQGNR